MNFFKPLIRQPSPSALPLVSIPPVSLPALGSVKAQAPIHSPLVRRGKYFCFCSEAIDLTDGERVVGRDVHRKGGVGFAQLFDRESAGDITHSAAAEFPGRDHSHHPDLSGFGKNFARQFLVMIPLIGMGQHFVAGKRGHALEKSAFFFGQWMFKNHSREDGAEAVIGEGKKRR